MKPSDESMNHGPCCSASRAGPPQDRDLSAVGPRSAEVVSSGKRATSEIVQLEGGQFPMGTDDPIGFPADGEGPVRAVTLRPFWIDAYAVSNARFAEFVGATGYITDAERYGWSFVFGGLLPDDFEPTQGATQAPWWRQVFGANWRHPEGPHSSSNDRMNHPVVHVSWSDAASYCAWAGMRLPTEAEWEYAARGGLQQKRYAWGDELKPNGEWHLNIWQGTFPSHNTTEDGYLGTAPVDSFPPNGFGLHNVSGNVWEWCSDWFATIFHLHDPREDPTGPPIGQTKVIRGGSYLCHDSYCNRYRVAARSSNTLDSSTGNMGFRCVKEVS
jgi:sulfatase modifying factor 1